MSHQRVIALTWIVTYGVQLFLYLPTDSSKSAQSAPETKDAVVAPLWPKLVPIALWRVVKNPFPQPPPQHDCAAVVESPARKNAWGEVARHSSVDGTGDAAATNAKMG